MGKIDGYFDGSWHVAIPVSRPYREDEVGSIDMAGVKPEETKLVRLGHKYFRAYIVEVDSEKLYRECMRPIWREYRKEAREKHNAVSRLTCDHKSAGYAHPESLDQFSENSGNEVPADESLNPSCIFENRSFITELWDYIATLASEEQVLANAILTKRPDKAVMKELGMEKQSTYSSRKIKVKKKLQQRFAGWL